MIVLWFHGLHCFIGLVFILIILVLCSSILVNFFFFSIRRRHTSCELVTGVQSCALPICGFRAGRPRATPDGSEKTTRRAAMNPIFADIPTTIFETMSRLAGQHQAINLGQGFPDDPGPEDVRRAAAEAVLSGWNQYPPMMGLPALREAIAAHYKRFHALDLNWETEVMVTRSEEHTSALQSIMSNS